MIIDWHILSDGNPNQHKDEALEFFDEMSSKYAGYNNVIYEICNEPQNSDWNSQIKPYSTNTTAYGCTYSCRNKQVVTGCR